MSVYKTINIFIMLCSYKGVYYPNEQPCAETARNTYETISVKLLNSYCAEGLHLWFLTLLCPGPVLDL